MNTKSRRILSQLEETMTPTEFAQMTLNELVKRGYVISYSLVPVTTKAKREAAGIQARHPNFFRLDEATARRNRARQLAEIRKTGRLVLGLL
jgi:hypothetical protein